MFEDLRIDGSAKWLASSPVAKVVATDETLPIDTRITLIEVYARFRGVTLNRVSVRVFVTNAND